MTDGQSASRLRLQRLGDCLYEEWLATSSGEKAIARSRALLDRTDGMVGHVHNRPGIVLPASPFGVDPLSDCRSRLE
jgi:hypothetical protein